MEQHPMSLRGSERPARYGERRAGGRAVRALRWPAGAAIAVAAGILAVAVPAGAASAAPAAKAPSKPVALSTSWPTARSGIALAYPKLATGARAELFVTGNGGKTWRRLPAPPVSYPADNDMPLVTWAGGTIAITNGTRVVASRDSGRHWSRVPLADLPKARSLFVGPVTIADGRLFTVVSTIDSAGNGAEHVYSGPVRASTLRAVRGLSIAGGETYGDLTAIGGGVQVSFGANFNRAHYWLSRHGAHFTAAPLPCPASQEALLGGIRDGKPIALCSSAPSTTGPGTNTHRVWIAPRLGGKFKVSGPVLNSANQQLFAAASDKDLVMAGTFSLYLTGNAGRTWATRLPQPNGAFWQDLAFPSSSVGVADVQTVTNKLKSIGTVYRTTNGGGTWHALALP
jgi:photosystem II stability/assembly factor-like uncharacterized protein